jgi:hypothetical protein
MKTQTNCKFVMPSRHFAEVAAVLENAQSFPRKTKRLRLEATQLEEECTALAASGTLKNGERAWLHMLQNAYRLGPHERRPEAEALTSWMQYMKRFKSCFEAEKMTFIHFSVEWKRSSTWGWCPAVAVQTNGHTGHYRASGYGYDKLSSAVFHALDSATLDRFAIDNWENLKGIYGFTENWIMPEINFSGCGLSTLEHLLEDAEWPKHQFRRRSYNRAGDTIGAYYSNKVEN